MSAVLNFQTALEKHTCPSCFIDFALPPRLIQERRKDGKSFYCPRGHSMSYAESENDKLKKQLARAEQDLEWERGRVKAKEREVIAQKALVTKAKKKLARVDHGVCPECNRTFANVARHMQTQHGVECNQPPKGSKVRG